MINSLGSQIFGAWYNVYRMAFLSCFFFYLPLMANNMPTHMKQKIPPFMLSKKLWFTVGFVAAIFSIAYGIMILK